MILGQISYLDCLVFLLFLIPQLLLQVNLIELIAVASKALPFLLIQLPYGFIKERFFTQKSARPPFIQQATPFEDFVIRIVRYAFANIPSKIGRAFFSKGVALPFFRFRLLRHGYLNSPIAWEEVSLKNRTRGLWISHDGSQKADLVLYYCHGGGFSMGSSYFYLEFLLAWLSLLKEAGYRNPAIFALEYDLVPDAQFPTQLKQTVTGYEYVCSITQDPSRICVSGDSAGATLILSLLLVIAGLPDYENHRPGYASLISPWPTLVSMKNRDTRSDYLNTESLHLYGRQYAGNEANLRDPLVSPGVCKDIKLWSKASPAAGFTFMYGSEEVFGPEIRDLVTVLRKSGSYVSVREEPGSIHAWPVAALFLADTQTQRQKGLRDLTIMIRRAIDV